MRRSTIARKLPKPKRRGLTSVMEQMIRNGQIQEGTEAWKMGKCSIFVSPPVEGQTGWHMSISHPTRYPTWDEVAHARYELLPDDITMAMPLPPSKNYVNIHPNCFQLVQVPDGWVLLDKDGDA